MLEINLTEGDRLSLIAALRVVGDVKNIHEIELVLEQGKLLLLHRRGETPYRQTEYPDDDTFDLKFCD